VLIRLQTQRSRDSEFNATLIVETASPSGEETHLKNKPKSNIEFTTVED
jgi:hypothetical protein